MAAVRQSEAGMGGKGRGANLISFDELRRGRTGLFMATCHCRLASVGKRFSGVRTQEIAYAKCHGEVAYYPP